MLGRLLTVLPLLIRFVLALLYRTSPRPGDFSLTRELKSAIARMIKTAVTAGLLGTALAHAKYHGDGAVRRDTRHTELTKRQDDFSGYMSVGYYVSTSSASSSSTSTDEGRPIGQVS